MYPKTIRNRRFRELLKKYEASSDIDEKLMILDEIGKLIAEAVDEMTKELHEDVLQNLNCRKVKERRI